MKQDLSEMPEILKKEMVVADRNPFLPEIWEEIGDYQIALNQFLESNHSEKTFFEHNLIVTDCIFQRCPYQHIPFYILTLLYQNLPFP